MTVDVILIETGPRSATAPNPRFPDGRVERLPIAGRRRSCARNVPYPSPACGLYEVRCLICGAGAFLDVAGRADDPRVIVLPCNTKG